MIKRTLEISKKPAHLTCRLQQLLIQPYDEPDNKGASVPCEDIAMVVVDQDRTTYSHAALQTLMAHGATLVVCGKNHLPAGLLLPLTSNTELVLRLHEQINASRPLTKSLWKQVVVAKVLAQAGNLTQDASAQRKLIQLSKEVKSGDSTCVESQAARIYWNALFRKSGICKHFRRQPEADNAPNAFLNYGYAIVRAAVARAIVTAGLHPALGIHHHNRSNAFCLADDLMEPLRPLVDRRVIALCQRGRSTLDQLTKAYLLQTLAESTCFEKQTGPLLVHLHRYLASFVRCMQSRTKKLEIPKIMNQAVPPES